MSKNTYWITTTNGIHGQVEGTEERDRWTPRGWQVVEEPSATDFVYLRNPETGGIAPFAYGSVDTWQQMGWEFSAPPEPVDVTKDPAVFAQDQQRAKPAKKAAEAKDNTPPAESKPAAGADKNTKE